MRGAMGLRWLIIAAAAWMPLAAATGLVGSPPYARFAPDIDAYPQNFAIVEDADGIVYVGNTNGVLEFDGERWSLTALDNRELARSLAAGPDGRIYVGGYGMFGHLERDDSGRARFVDLTPKFADALAGQSFADIWDVLSTPEGVYFRALRDVFFWDPASGATRHWHHDGRFGAIVHHRGRTLLQFRGEGIRRRDGDGWTLLPETRDLVDLVFNLTPLADGGLLTTGVDGRWNVLRDDRIAAAAMPPGMPASSDFQAAEALRDGSIALASSDGVVYVVNPSLASERHFKVDPGWLSDLATTADGGFLVSANLAIYRVQWPTAWTVLGEEHGAVGSLQRLAHWNGDDYLLTSARTQRLVPTPGGIPGFENVAWYHQGGYDLLGLADGSALFAASHKLLHVRGGNAVEVSDELIYPRQFQPSRFRAQRIYIGTESGLRYVDSDGDAIALSPIANQGIEQRVNSLVETSAEVLWYGTERHGVWRAMLGADGSIEAMARIGDEHGLRLGKVPESFVARLPDGAMIVSTHHGFFRLDGDRFVPDALFGLDTLRHTEEVLRVVPAGEELWAYGFARAFRRLPGGNWVEQPVRQMRRGAIESFVHRGDGGAALVATQALMLRAGDASTPSGDAPKIALRSVMRVLPDGSEHPLPLHPAAPVELSRGDFGIRFRFALPDLSPADDRSYQGRLAGYEEEFSAWSRSSGYTYSRLSPGRYALQVRARDSNGRLSEITPYELIVLPPWYATWWARATWLLIGCAVLWLAIRFAVRRRTERLAADTRRLETTIAARTRDLAEANRRLEQMAHLDGLTGIANRRRLDDYLRAAWADCRERRAPLAVIVIDVDHFKQFNDSRGHLAGDQLLKDIVTLLSRALRGPDDLLARYGGEEFLAILPGADADTAARAAEAMRRAVDASPLDATVSIGTAVTIPENDAPQALVQAADRALYEAKRAGRNRVVAGVA